MCWNSRSLQHSFLLVLNVCTLSFNRATCFNALVKATNFRAIILDYNLSIFDTSFLRGVVSLIAFLY